MRKIVLPLLLPLLFAAYPLVWHPCDDIVWNVGCDIIAGDIKAVRYYDYNDTRYYIKPAGLTKIKELEVMANANLGGVLYVDAQNKRVGINTNTPQEALHVVGNILVPENYKINFGNGQGYIYSDGSYFRIGFGNKPIWINSWDDNVIIYAGDSQYVVLGHWNAPNYIKIHTWKWPSATEPLQPSNPLGFTYGWYDSGTGTTKTSIIWLKAYALDTSGKGKLSIEHGGSELAYIDTQGWTKFNGPVGIMANPGASYALNIGGSLGINGNIVLKVDQTKTPYTVVIGGGGGIGKVRVPKARAFEVGETLFVNDTSGQVGIGIESPKDTLHVKGGLRVEAGTFDIVAPKSPPSDIRTGSEADSGRVWIQYGAVSAAPNLILVDYDEGPAIVFRQTGTGNETNPQYQAYIGMHSNSNDLFVMGGNFGIGTSSPQYKLHVQGDVYSSGYLRTDTGICIGNDCKASWGEVASEGGWVDMDGIVKLANASDSVNATTLWIDNTNGRVGIGTYSPSAKLTIAAADYTGAIHIVSDTGEKRFSLLPRSDGGWEMFDYYGGNWNEGIVQRGGSVGIGVVPSYKLDVYSPSGGVIVGRFRVGTEAGSWIRFENTEGRWDVGMNGLERFSIYNPDTGKQALVIDPSGNVGIGTIDPTEKLDARGNIQFGAGSYWQLDEGSWTGSGHSDQANIMYEGPNPVSTFGFHGQGPKEVNVIIDGRLGVGYASEVKDLPYGSAIFAGKIGVHVTNPATRLHVNGSVRLENGNIIQWTSADGTTYWNVLSVDSSDDVNLNTGGGHDIKFTEAGNVRMIIKGSTDRVGIGTEDPEKKLDVRGDFQVISGGGSFKVDSSGNIIAEI